VPRDVAITLSVLLTISLTTAWILLGSLLHRRQVSTVSRWPAVPGLITSSKVDTDYFPDVGTVEVTRVVVSYKVGTERYSKEVSKGGDQTSSFPLGSSVWLYYNPLDHYEAFLKPRDAGNPDGFLLFYMWAVVLTAGLVMIWNWSKIVLLFALE
jgi:hypothetical protein